MGKSNLIGSGAMNGKIEGRWCRTPAINSFPTVDIPCFDDPSDAMNTFCPFCHKLRCTWDPEPKSSNAYLQYDKNTLSFTSKCLL